MRASPTPHPLSHMGRDLGLAFQATLQVQPADKRLSLVLASALTRHSSVRIKKALAGLSGGDLEKAKVACAAAPRSHAASGVFLPMPASACLLVAPEESVATPNRMPLISLLTTLVTTRRPSLLLISAGACPSIAVG